jgi:hypothetical protein
MNSVFTVDKTAFRFVLAAIFGASPEVLLAIIKRQGEDLKKDLKSTQPGGADEKTSKG